jgi:hypothetical protein
VERDEVYRIVAVTMVLVRGGGGGEQKITGRNCNLLVFDIQH